MSKEPDFKTWDEVRDYLDTDEVEMVTYHVWAFNRGWMGCSEGCCDDSYSSVDDAIAALKSYSNNKLDEVTK